MQGYIKLHRQLLEWEWYKNSTVKDLFIHCLLRANHAEKKWQGILIKKGSFITSLDNLAFETGLTKMQVRTAIDKLKLTHEITYKPTHQYSIITINNWDKYQLDNTPSNTQITYKQHTNNTQITLNNNDNNENNEKNIYLVEENKKIDPYTHPIIEKYVQEYQIVYGKRCYLNSKHRNKIVELYGDIDNFEDTLPTVFKRLKSIKFENIDFKPDNAWLLKEDNYIKVLEGSYGTGEEHEYNAYA